MPYIDKVLKWAIDCTWQLHASEMRQNMRAIKEVRAILTPFLAEWVQNSIVTIPEGHYFRAEMVTVATWAFTDRLKTLCCVLVLPRSRGIRFSVDSWRMTKILSPTKICLHWDVRVINSQKGCARVRDYFAPKNKINIYRMARRTLILSTLRPPSPVFNRVP